jgi:hypothetical protein
MWARSRLLLAAFAAALALTAAVGVAGANRLNLGTTRFTMRWREFNVPTGITAESREERVRHCPLTLSGSFHSATMAKVVSFLVGYVTSAAMGTCTGEGGRVTLLSTGLPWHLTYREFSGTLPAITNVRLALAGLRMSIEVPVFPLEGASCLITTTAREPLNLDFQRERGGTITAVNASGNGIDARDVDSGWCDGLMPPLSWALAGTGALENGSSRSLTVTLI